MIMKRKIKVGDWVTRIRSDWQDVRVGEVYKVSEFDYSSDSIELVGFGRKYDINNFQIAKKQVVLEIIKDL